MAGRYEPKDHIQHLELAPRAEGILDQRDITIQSFQTNLPFDLAALDAGLDKAWLTPAVRLGVFARSRRRIPDCCTAVLGLQDQLSIRAYDYDARRPLWFSWRNAIVDTVNIQYFRDDDGLLRFTTTGGGRRITEEKLQEFNSTFLNIPKEAVTRLHFDLTKLRELCFSRFVDRLYMVRFSDIAGEEYRSIDHALFQSRCYIDPQAPRLQEVRGDTLVKIESFDSDIKLRNEDLAEECQVRFFIRGLNGTLRLRFPKMVFKKQLVSPEQQAEVFYRIVDETVSAILNADYYEQHLHTLDDLNVDLGMFPDMVDLSPFREVFKSPKARFEFILGINVGAPWNEWLPHLRAIDELLPLEALAKDVDALLNELAACYPEMAVRLLAKCQGDCKVQRVARLLAGALASRLQSISTELRVHIEEALLAWHVDCEHEAWDVDPDTHVVIAGSLRWKIESLSFEILPSVIWKLVGVIHAKLMAHDGDVFFLLKQFHWCVEAAKRIPAFHSRIHAALRLVASDRVPRSVADGNSVLETPVKDMHSLDDGILEQFGLPLWPLLSVCHRNDKLHVVNVGIGTAFCLEVYPAGDTPAIRPETAVDLGSGQDLVVAMNPLPSAVEVRFFKFGRIFNARVVVAPEATTTNAASIQRELPVAINRSRLAAQLKCRERIDPKNYVIGTSPALLQVFEQISHANYIGGRRAVLLLGEAGVGKTHVAKLIHESSVRAPRPFKVVNAGGGGGDLNIQRGEWIGYGKGHGIQGIERNGRSGHLIGAQGGTLFIDEFAALSADLQVVFLSVLEGRAIEKVGGESFTPDVRCIFATNADIQDFVDKGILRPDLLDRIAMKIRIPPLRERCGDILLLARHFAGKDSLCDRCLLALIRHSWPANIRELQTCIENAQARKMIEGASSFKPSHFELPFKVIASVMALSDDACRTELWRLADEIARSEGFSHGTGIQRRAGEIMGVGESQASKLYRALRLISTSAP